MALPHKGKKNLHVDNLGDWEKNRENEVDEDEEGEAFGWSKPILIDEGRDYVWAREKQIQRDNLVHPKDGVATKLALEIEKKIGNHETRFGIDIMPSLGEGA